MKKIIKLLLLLVLMIPVVVFADVAVPDTLSFKVEVKKSDGIDYYDYKSIREGEPIGRLPKGTTLVVDTQIVEDDEEYLGAGYKDTFIYVKATDVVAKGELDVKDKVVRDLPEPMKVRVKGEVILRKGPSAAHEESGRLSNIETTYEYMVYSPTYIYINYKGQKGWVEAVNEALSYDGADYILTKSYKGACGEVPIGTKFNNVWKTFPDDSNANVFYHNCSFALPTYRPGILKINGERLVYELKIDVPFFETLDDDDSEMIKKGKEIIVLSEVKSNKDIYYVEYKGQEGFITINLDYEAEFIKEDKGKKVRDDDDEEEKDSSSVVIVCVVVGLAVAFSALGIILYISKKGKKEVVSEKNS